MSPIKIEFVVHRESERAKKKKNEQRSRVNKNVDVWQLTSFSFARKQHQWDANRPIRMHTQNISLI